MLIKDSKEFDIFVASKIGSFKHIKYQTDVTKNNKKYTENLVEIKQLQKDDSITCMEWGNVEQTEILIGRKNQQIQLYNTLQGFTHTYTSDFAEGDIVGLGRCKRKLLAAVSSGTVKIWSKKQEVLVNVGGKLDRMRICDAEPSLFATGGEENDLKIYRIGEPNPIFTAKNLAHDWLQLRRPVWVTDLTFLDENTVAVCSRHGYVRLYDSRAQRRPVCNVDFTNMAATCIANSFNERKVLVGFGRGQLHQVDLRKGRPDKGYKGAAGAITSIALKTDEKLIVSASLDRHMRVHRFDTKELVYKQYLTSKLSCVLVQNNNSTPLRNPPVEEKEIKKESEESEGDEMDDLFGKMETIREKPKKRPVVEDSEQDEKNIKPSAEGSTVPDTEDAIAQLLKSTEKKKRRMEKKKKEKRAKSVFFNA